jgi:RNA polymerase sigma factor (sigma-70 family)
MESGPIGAVLQHVRSLVAVEATSHLADAELVDRFLTTRDEAWFGALLHRHGPLVWRVCQRVLRHRQNAEDVFQATFLALVHKAATIRKHASVACWLHGVAYRMARRLRAEQHRQSVAASREAGPLRPANGSASEPDLPIVLDEELQRLPEDYRAPLVLCYLQGRTRDEAAEQLGWSLGTFKRRLDRGRKLLATQLRRRGVTLGCALSSAVLGEDALSATVQPTLSQATLRAALLVVAKQPVAGLVSAQVIALLQSNQGTGLGRVALTAAIVLTLVILAGAAGWTALSVNSGDAPLPDVSPARPSTAQLPWLAKSPDVQTQSLEDPAVIRRGDYLVNRVARCGSCHTPSNDPSQALQGANVRIKPKVTPQRTWSEFAPDITASGRAGAWTPARMTSFLSTGAKSAPPMPAYSMSPEDALAVTAYLRSLAGKNSPTTKR